MEEIGKLYIIGFVMKLIRGVNVEMLCLIEVVRIEVSIGRRIEENNFIVL